MNGPSRTAMMVAAYRARASAREAPICADPFAAQLAGDAGMEQARRYDEVYPPAELWIALRTAFLDRKIRALLGAGVRQAVLLGAGLDARPLRIGGAGVSWFEVDRAPMQAEKRERVAALPGYPARFVSCDFEREDFLDRLIAGGFRADEPALFVWEGVTMYLAEAAVRSTLARIAHGCERRSTVIFDYVGAALARGRVKDPEDAGVLAHLTDLMEPIRFGIDDVLPLLFEAGYRRVRTVSFDELALELTGTYERGRKFRFQHIAVASVAPITPVAR